MRNTVNFEIEASLSLSIWAGYRREQTSLSLRLIKYCLFLVTVLNFFSLLCLECPKLPENLSIDGREVRLIHFSVKLITSPASKNFL